MGPDRSDRDLLAELEAERASTDHWRQVARRRSETYDELKHRRIVRAALAAERLALPLLQRAEARLKRVRGGAERAALSVAALPGRRAAAGRRARLAAAIRELPPPPTTDRLISLVLIDVTGATPAALPPRDGVEVILVDAGPHQMSVGTAVQRAIDTSTGDLVCLLTATSEPLDDAWLLRLPPPCATTPPRPPPCSCTRSERAARPRATTSR